MTEEQLEKLEKSKDPDIKELLKEWKAFNESPYKESYMTLLKQIEDWNAQLELREEEVVIEEKPQKIMRGRVDLFSDKDSKEFDRVFKYFSDLSSIIGTLDAIRSKMNPKELEDVQKDKRMRKNTGVAV